MFSLDTCKVMDEEIVSSLISLSEDMRKKAYALKKKRSAEDSEEINEVLGICKPKLYKCKVFYSLYYTFTAWPFAYQFVLANCHIFTSLLLETMQYAIGYSERNSEF